MTEILAARRRTVRSFVMRGGRVTAAQRRALAELWPQYGVEFAPAPLDLDRLFGRRVARTLEIGFGNGEHLAARAAAEPGRDFIGMEVHQPGVGHLLLRAGELGLHNLRVICHDAVEALQAQITPGTLDEVQILFPDPWPKKRHHKRRIIQPTFVELLATRLQSGGRVHLATDWESYAAQMLVVLDGCALLENTVTAGGFAPRPEYRAATRFEQRGTRLGHTVRDLAYRRRA
jgi:tRNA (guanine-N7-)-methyltransferase